MKIQAILFDMIGTTIREKTPNTIRNCFRRAFEKYGVTPGDKIISANRGKDASPTIASPLAKMGFVKPENPSSLILFVSHHALGQS